MSDTTPNPISTFISGQLPEFVRIDHPTLVAFLTSYYEWLDSDNTYLRSSQKLENVVDIDRTLEEFITNFKNQYLFGFPETMAISEKTKKPVDPVKLMKNIKNFYNAKGTEKTFDFLFRILYDTSIEFYYPKNDILKLSDGKWIVRRSIKLGNQTGNAIYDSVGNTIVQRDKTGKILASARVLDATTYNSGGKEISELFLGGINGEFLFGKYEVEFLDTEGTTRKEERVFPVVGTPVIQNGGSGYKIGDTVVITPAKEDTGTGAYGKVSEVDTFGKIRKIIINNHGINYKSVPTISIKSELGTGFLGTIPISSISEQHGYFANNDGKLSTNKVLQDNHFYQNFSYVILSEVTIDRYKDVLKKLLNPAGLAFFGKVQIKRCAFADIQQSSSIIQYEVPIIGHYTPYTFLTNDDLEGWFKDPDTGLQAGYDPTQHDKIIRNDLSEDGEIDTADMSLALLNGDTKQYYLKSIGNPVSFPREFTNPLVSLKTVGFQNADPFWIIYEHPNKKVIGPVVARIPYDLKKEFLTNTANTQDDYIKEAKGTTGYWSEWAESSTANREEWAAGFTSGERYVLLNYNPVKGFTQNYYTQNPKSFASNKSSLVQPGKLLPILYYDNVFTYAGQKNFEKLSSDNSNESQLLSTIPSNSGKAVNYDIPDQYEFSTDGKNVIGILSPSQATIQTGGLSESSKNSLSEDPNKLLTTSASVPPPLSYNKFAYWDSATSTHYLTYRSVTGGYGLPCNNCKETGHLGISGLTATSKEAISKMVKSLRGEIRPDWNGISGGGWENLDPFPADYNGLISMNTESWDALYSNSEGIADPDNPNSVGNFIRDKILIPIFAGGVSPDGTTFGGLQENFPNAILANYGHPSSTPRNISNYYGYPGFRGRGEFARGSIGETLTLPSGLTYTSYAPSVSCPTCVWDGRIGLHSLDPNKVQGQSSYEARRNIYGTAYPNQAVENTQFSEKLHTEKWYPFCKAVSGWQPSFYTATRDLGLEASHIGRSISLMSRWKSQIFQEQSDAGIEPTKKYLIPFISNKAFTVGTGDGGYAGFAGKSSYDLSYGAYTASLQDLSYYTPNQFVDLYIAPCLSGQSKGAVDGFYMWTGEQSYACQFGLGIGINNPLTVEVLDENGNVIDWKKNPLTLGYGYVPYWDWNHNWFNKPGAPTGGSYIVGKNGTPRLSWYIGGGQFGDADPWQGGNISPSWPTSSAPLPLENSSQMYHARKNIVAYQAFLDGVTGQYNAQYNYLEPHKYSYLASTFPTWFVPDESTRTETLPVWSEKTSNGGVKYLVLNGVKNPKDIKISSWRMGGLVTDTGHLVMFYDTETVFNTVKWATESIPTASGFDSLSVGYDHSIALKTDGTVVGWGNEGVYAGKLGTEGVMRQITAAGKTVTKIDAGANHNLALLNDGQVISWGRGQGSQLSDIDKNWSPYGYTPQTDEIFKNYQDRSTRWNDAGTIRVYRCGLEDGNRASGCDSPNGSSLTAHHFAGGVSAGAYLAPGLTQGWEYDTGAPYDYQFPRSSTNALTGQNQVLNPNFGGGGWTAAAGGTSVFGTSYKKYVDISAGRSHNLILASDGKIETWGDNYYYTVTGSGLHNKDKRTSASPGGAFSRAGGGQSPNPTGENTAPTVKSFKTTANSVARIGTGYYQSMVIRPDGSLFAWDRNEWGESLPASGLPSKTATGATGFVSVDGGYHHCCALRSNGTIACWGAGDSLKTNDGTNYNYGQSIVPDGLGTFTKVVCGYDYTIAVQASTGEIIVWGNTEQVKNKFVFKAPTLPNFTIDNKFVNILDWSRLREWNFRVKKTSNDGRWTIPMGMAPGTTFAFNHLSTRPADDKRPTNPIRSRAGVGVTGAIISNPLFNSLTGSSTVFSYSDGNSYQDKGWNTADRIGYVKAVRSVPNKPNEVEIAVEPYFFVGGPMYGQYYGADTAMWFSSTVNYDSIPYYDNRDRDLMITDGITHGMTSGNAPYPTSMGVPNPVGTFAELAKIGANSDPSTTNQQPKWGHIFTPGDIISFGAVGATFELVTYGQVSGNFQRTTEAEVDHVWSMVDNLVVSQWSAALTYWNSLYNTGLDGDFSIQFNTVENSWNVYGPGNRNIINGWRPKTTPTSCSSVEIVPSISVAQNDADNSLEISYTYNNTCSTEKYMAWPDLPPMDLGESVSYFDTRINAGSFGSGVGAFIDLDKNTLPFSSNYPSQLYSPIHLAKTKFSGECCVDNNFVVNVALTEYSPSDDNHEISLVVFPPQDTPSVILAQQGNAFYKAYQDRFSFQIATWNESQITQNGQAKLAAGQSKTYKVNIKFAKVPPVAGVQASLLPGMGSIGIGTDSAAIIETLTPYKEFLDRRYPPQTYTPDYRPVRGILLALEHLIEPSPTASNYNPYGWDKNSVNYTLAGGYPNTIGYTGVAAYVKDQLENKDWDRVMIWTPSGLSYKIAANYPPRSVTHWTEPNRVYTPPTGATSSITNNMDNAETIMKTMVDALDDTKQVGFWLGNSIYSNTEFDSPNLYPMGSTGFDVTVLQNNLSIVDNITNNSRGISKGIAGLDAWNKFSAVSPSTVDTYSLITTGSHPSIKYITEGRACDYMHRMNPTYIDFYSPSGITQVDSSFGLANYFTPDHETWVGMNFSNSIDLVVRGSTGCAHEIKMARGPLIKSVIDMGMIPVVFEPMEQDYIYGGPLTETGNCSCTGCDCCQDGCYTVQGIYDCQGCSGCFGCTGCGITGATCSGALCCGLLANGTECFNTFYGIYDCEGCSGFGGCTGCEVTPTDPCESCASSMPCVNVWTGQLDCQGCSGCWGCTGCGQTAGATGCALCSPTNPGYTVQGIYDCKGCSGCHGFTGCSRGATGATGCNLCRADLPCYTLAGIYDCAGCSGCFGCDGCTTIASCVGCQCCMTGGYNRVTGLKDCEGCSGCFGFTGCGITGTTGSTGCSGSGGTACCGTTGNGTLCFNIVTGMYDCLGCSGFNGCTGCGMTASLTGCALCSPTSPCFTVDGIYDCKGCSGCHGCIGCSVTGPTSCTGCGCCSSSTTGACFNIVTGFYDCVGCSGCASCTGCGSTGSIACQKCMTGGYNRVTGLKDCIGCSGCFGFTGCGVTAPATGCARCSQIDPCYTTNIPSGYDCVGCSGCWQCTGCPVIEPSCTGANCCGITANGTQCWNTFVGKYDCVGCSGYGGCTGCGITGVSAGPTGCAVCSTWLDLPCYNTVTGIYDCVGCSGCASCTGCGITAAIGCTGCGCCSEIYDCFNITGGYDCVGCSGCYNCGGCDQRYSLCSECTTGDCGITSSANYQFCADCGCSDIYSNCNQCTQLDCDNVFSVNNQFCKTCGCVSEIVDCAECLRLNCNGVLCRTECPDCYDGGNGSGKYTNCNQCLQGDCDSDTSINHEFCLGCGCQQRYNNCDRCVQNDCDNQFSINYNFCWECGCTPTLNCSECVASKCVGQNCEQCVACNTVEPYENCGQCVPADCTYPYRLNHTYCNETCGCVANGETGGETGQFNVVSNIGSNIEYSDFRKITIKSFLTMPIGPEFNCKNSDILLPPTPQVEVKTINGTEVNTAEWNTDSNNIIYGTKSMYFDISEVKKDNLSTLLYLNYYFAKNIWAELYIVDNKNKEYLMANVGPFSVSTSKITISFPFINPANPESEAGAITLGTGIVLENSPFYFRGNYIDNNNCIYRLKLHFKNSSNAIIPNSTTIKDFNYQLI